MKKLLTFLLILAMALSIVSCDEDAGTDIPNDPDVSDSDTSSDDTPGDDTPGDDTPGDDTPGDDTPGDDTPGDDTPGDDTPGNGIIHLYRTDAHLLHLPFSGRLYHIILCFASQISALSSQQSPVSTAPPQAHTGP